MGYISGVSSENVYGTRYAKATEMSSGNAIIRGIDQTSDVKYQTTSGSTYMQHHSEQHAKVSETVGVMRPQDTYEKPIHPATVHKFFGSDPSTGSAVVQQQAFQKNADAFFADACNPHERRQPQ